MQPIYLDYAATTPCEPSVVELMNQHLTLDGVFANSGSRTHIFGWQAENSLEKARNQIAKVLNAKVTEIIFTSGATESNNLALNNANLNGCGEILSSKIEHSAVLQVLENLHNKGQKIKLLSPDKFGKISLENLKNSINSNTKMISLMALNNELGTLNPIYEIGDFLHQQGILFHIDAAQAFGKIPLDMQKLKADFVSICGHKIYAPKGIGALFIRENLKSKVKPIMLGGSQEMGLRSGTLPVHLIAGFGLAAEIAEQRMQADYLHLAQAREFFLSKLKQINYIENGASLDKFPGIINLTFTNVDNEELIESLPELAFSLGSACNAGDIEPSKVLLGIGLSKAQALNSARFSFGRFTTLAEAEQAGVFVQKVVKALQKT